jgi:hypothetical protein
MRSCNYTSEGVISHRNSVCISCVPNPNSSRRVLHCPSCKYEGTCITHFVSRLAPPLSSSTSQTVVLLVDLLWPQSSKRFLRGRFALVSDMSVPYQHAGYVRLVLFKINVAMFASDTARTAPIQNWWVWIGRKAKGFRNCIVCNSLIFRILSLLAFCNGTELSWFYIAKSCHVILLSPCVFLGTLASDVCNSLLLFKQETTFHIHEHVRSVLDQPMLVELGLSQNNGMARLD